MSSGIGRGRGWLNIKTDARPGGNVTLTQEKPAPQELHIPDNKYKGIITLIQQISLDDDGILINRKLMSIYQAIKTECNNDAEIKDCAKCIYQLALKDEALAIKFAVTMSLKPFLSKPIYERKLRDFLIMELQEYFGDVKQHQTLRPDEFRNFVRMLCTFYSKAKLDGVTPLDIFAKPILNCFDMLLDSGNSQDLEVFTTNLALTITYLKNCCSGDLEEVFKKVRTLLIRNEFLTNKCRVWMLLALDLAYYKNGNFPLTLFDLYQEQLGEKLMADINVSLSSLTIQTKQLNQTPDVCQNDATTLQSNIEQNHGLKDNSPPQNTNQNKFSNYQSHPKQNIKTEQNSQSAEKSSSKFHPQNHTSDWDGQKDHHQTREKTGRPILGAGARLNKKNENWGDHSKKNSSGWDNKQVKQGYQDKKPSHKNNKGWQHDDRFDTDYN